MSIKYFITGTDTEIGKTYASVGLLKAFNRLNYTTLGLKPVASGILAGDLFPTDTVALHEAASIKIPLEEMTPFAFHLATAPHIAAHQLQQDLNLSSLNEACHTALQKNADIFIIEGFGGWFAPLNHQETMADFVKHHCFNVILVVGMRLGCLNHAMLTEKAIQQAGLKPTGWIANCIHPNMLFLEENIDTLQQCLTMPFLGTIGFREKAEDCLTLSPLITL